VSRPITRSGRDRDSSEARLVSRSSSDFVSAESFLLTLRASSDMIDHEEIDDYGKEGKDKCLAGIAKRLDSSLEPHTLIFLSITCFQTVSLMSEQNDSEVAEFYRRELAQALAEQAFGISRSEVTHFTENEAEATITLLEGNTINVVLSIAGYKVL